MTNSPANDRAVYFYAPSNRDFSFEKDLNEFIVKTYSTFLKGDMYLGGWLDKDKQTGQVYAYFDASKNIQNLDEVVSVAVSSRQIAIYDVNNDRSIYIDYENNQRLWYWLDPKNEEGKTWLK